MELLESIRRSFGRVACVAFLVAVGAGCAASGEEAVGPRLAQHRTGGSGGGGGGMTCNQDTDCHIRVPAARACPAGGTSVPTACCRANYCGVCWSDCPAAGSHATSPDEPSTTTL